MRQLAAAIALAIGCGAPLAAHHSFATYYFEDQTVSIEGVVAEFALKAPHAWLYVLATDEQGRVQRYSAEWSNPTRLERDGITKDTLRAGDRVMVTGSPGRTASEYAMHLKRIERLSDGWKWGGPPVRR